MKIAVISSHTPSLFWFRMDMMLEFIRRGSTVIAIGNEPESKWAEEFRKSGIRYLSVPVQKKENGSVWSPCAGAEPPAELHINPMEKRENVSKIRKPESESPAAASVRISPHNIHTKV